MVISLVAGGVNHRNDNYYYYFLKETKKGGGAMTKLAGWGVHFSLALHWRKYGGWGGGVFSENDFPTDPKEKRHPMGSNVKNGLV